jgi:hypothetical protein
VNWRRGMLQEVAEVLVQKILCFYLLSRVRIFYSIFSKIIFCSVLRADLIQGWEWEHDNRRGQTPA